MHAKDFGDCIDRANKTGGINLSWFTTTTTVVLKSAIPHVTSHRHETCIPVTTEAGELPRESCRLTGTEHVEGCLFSIVYLQLIAAFRDGAQFVDVRLAHEQPALLTFSSSSHSVSVEVLLAQKHADMEL